MAAQIGHTGAQGDRTVKVKNPVLLPLGTSLRAAIGPERSPVAVDTRTLSLITVDTVDQLSTLSTDCRQYVDMTV